MSVKTAGVYYAHNDVGPGCVAYATMWYRVIEVQIILCSFQKQEQRSSTFLEEYLLAKKFDRTDLDKKLSRLLNYVRSRFANIQ